MRETHEHFMRRALELAKKGEGLVSPNPLVGAVIVKDNRIIGEGYHARQGAPHAEPSALKNATEDVTGATLYVTLEPCCHTKKLTPPCAPLVIEKKIKTVVIANLDPNPHVHGKGVEQLKASGIEVITGVLESEGEALNEIFFHRMRTGRPFVTLKTAATLDGKTALPTGESKWITGPEARLDGHQGRRAHDAIVIGAETLRRDDPELTVRLPGTTIERMPWRIVLTQSGNLPTKSKLFTDSYRERTLIVTGADTKISVLPETQIIRLNTLAPFPFSELYQHLATRGIHSLWLEGGSALHSLFLQSGEVDRLVLYLAPKLMGQGQALFTHTSANLNELSRLTDL
ncbi:MAG: bifunctional diaminohydroxyphosphoribosylaminopyrimidine deaminase/5-amino-6-(5-phosphoribosylamino)uracil reductase RibD, partial [Bacteriovoracia bacterium]